MIQLKNIKKRMEMEKYLNISGLQGKMLFISIH